ANDPESVLFAALCHDLGKALTPKDILPHHYEHGQKGVAPTEHFSPCPLCKPCNLSSTDR
ncbi:HD domain-containing protein, partial [Glaesserella parasuis]|nr:HD domain-containing protein [Glaesserella parasuis]